MSSLTHVQVIARLMQLRGKSSVRGFAVELGVSTGYLYDVLTGKRNVGPKILAYLQLEEQRKTIVTYHPKKKEE